MALLSDTIPTYCSFLDSGLFVSWTIPNKVAFC